MARSAKTVSIRHLHAAVKTALEAAKKKHPNLKIHADAESGGSFVLPLYYRFPWICGLPPDPWVDYGLQDLNEFAQTFVASLASDKQVSALAVNGKFEAALYVSGGNVAIGFAPSDVSFTE